MENTENRRSLLDFQKSLNEQFEKIQSSYTAQGLDSSSFDMDLDLLTGDRDGQESLGISFIYHDDFLNTDIRVFFPLSSLKHILSNTNFEKTFLTKSWIRGFTHFRGDCFSVLDPINMLNENSYTPLDSESRIILFKETDSLRYGFVCKDISLINLEQQYFAMKLDEIKESSNTSVVVDSKIFNIFKSVNGFLDDESDKILKTVELAHQPAQILNLAHIQKYAKIYKYFINNSKDILQKQQEVLNSGNDLVAHKNSDDAQKLNILFFSRSLFIDNSGCLGVVVDSRVLNKYLYDVAPY